MCSHFYRSHIAVIRNKVTYMAVLLFSYRCLKGYRLLGNLHDVPYLFRLHSEFFSYFFRLRLPTQSLCKLPLCPYQLIDSFNHMYRYSYSPCLVCYGPCNRLFYPPGCIGAKLIALCIVKLFNCLYKSHIPFLNQVKKLHPSSEISLRYTNYKP